MPNAAARKATIPNQFHEMSGRQQIPSTQFIANKMTPSHKAVKESHSATSSDLEDVVFLRLPDVKAITGLSKSSLYALIREKSFPAPVQLGARAVAWVKSEVRQWAAERVHASRSAAQFRRADSCGDQLFQNCELRLGNRPSLAS